MAVTKYIVKDFNNSLAKQGSLCAMVASTIRHGDEISTSDSRLKGVGICTLYNSQFILNINTIEYFFYTDGSCTSSTNYKLMMAEVGDKTSDAGNVINTDTTIVGTRSADGKVTYNTRTGKSVVVNNLEARDQFAIHALKTLMDRMKKDPASVSDNEKMFICESAYKWAANMMTQASKTRATIETVEGGGNPKTEDTAKAIDIDDSDISTPSDKLLNNVVAALERTDIIDHLRGVWKKGNKEISGYYTNKGAKNATGYDNITAATSAGWSFKSGGYNEATEIVHFTEYTDLIKAYNKATNTQETNDEIEPLIDPNEEIEPGSVANKYWSQEAIIKLFRRLQMKKTLTAADDTDEYGKAVGQSLYLQRIVNPRQNEMVKDFLKNENPASNASSIRLKEFLNIYEDVFKHTPSSGQDRQKHIALEDFLNLWKKYLKHTSTGGGDSQEFAAFEDLIKSLEKIQETADNKTYERVLIKGFDTLLDKLDTMNTNLAAINTNIQAFTTAMNTRFTNLDDSVGNVQTGITNAKNTIIDAMPTCKYNPPSE